MLKSHLKSSDTLLPSPRTPNCLRVTKRIGLKSGRQALALPGVCRGGREQASSATPPKRAVLSAAVPICLAFYKTNDRPQPGGPGRPHSQRSISQSQSGLQTLSRGNSADVLTRPRGEEQNVKAVALSLRRVSGVGDWGAGEALVPVQGRRGAGWLHERGTVMPPQPPAFART